MVHPARVKVKKSSHFNTYSVRGEPEAGEIVEAMADTVYERGMEPLASLLADIRACRHCADRFAATASAHAPRPVLRASASATVCVAGQAPGIRVHRSGRPFTDPSGVRLRAWMGVDEDTFYDTARIAILPMAFCFPGHTATRADLPPPKDCARLWRAPLFEALPAIRLVLLVGKAAQDWHLEGRDGMAERVRRWTDMPSPQSDAPCAVETVPLPHPSWRNNAWLKANPWFETETLPKLRAALSRHLPSPS